MTFSSVHDDRKVERVVCLPDQAPASLRETRIQKDLQSSTALVDDEIASRATHLVGFSLISDIEGVRGIEVPPKHPHLHLSGSPMNSEDWSRSTPGPLSGDTEVTIFHLEFRRCLISTQWLVQYPRGGLYIHSGSCEIHLGFLLNVEPDK